MKLLQRYKRWIKLRRDYKDLSQLSDKQLKDIGINRGDIGSVVNGLFR